jgi:hypothetical protein
MENKNKIIYIFLNAIADGSGDFSFCIKLKNILDKIINVGKIHIVMNINNDIFFDFNKLHENVANNCKNKNIVQIDKNTPTHQINLNEQKFILNEQNLINLNEILTYICTIYKHMHGSNDTLICNTVINSKNNLNYNFIKFNDDDLQNIFEKEFASNILNIIKNKNDINDAVCLIDKELLLNFYNNFINNKKYSIWIINILKFFLLSDLKGKQNLNFIFVHNGLHNVKPAQLNIKNENIKDILLISFLCDNCFKHFNEFKYIKLSEGGYENETKQIYASGFNNNQYCLGINHIDENMIKQIQYSEFFSKNLSESIKTKYYICYFGHITDIIYVTNCVMLLKLRYFFEKIIEISNNNILEPIYVPYKCFNFIYKYHNFARKVFNATIDLCKTNITITYNNNYKIKICYFKSINNDDFLKFLYESNKLCILTGDQSFFEGISMKKHVIYDVLFHKIHLYEQFLKLLLKYIIIQYDEDLILMNYLYSIMNDHVDNIIKKNDLYNINNIHYDTFDIDSENIEDAVFKNKFRWGNETHTETYNFTYDKKNDNIECNLNGNIKKFNFNNIKKLYDLNFALCNYSEYDIFIELLKLKYNYDNNIEKLIINNLYFNV